MKIYTYDNGGTTIDRYTIIIDNDVYSMSINPNSPQGVNEYYGPIDEHIRKYLEFGADGVKKTNIDNLPASVLIAIIKHIEQR